MRAQIEAVERLCCADCRDQRADSQDGHDSFQIVGQHVQGHFGADPFQGLHLKVGRSHPVFDGAEGMLDGFAALTHLLGMLVEPLLDGLEDMLVLPAGDPALLARGATMLDRASLAGVGPVAMQGQPVLLVREVVDQARAGRAPIGVRPCRLI